MKMGKPSLKHVDVWLLGQIADLSKDILDNLEEKPAQLADRIDDWSTTFEFCSPDAERNLGILRGQLWS